MNRNQQKEFAKTLYLKSGITVQKELAARVGVSENTMGKWVKDEGWEKLRQNILLTRQEQLQYLLAELEELNKFISSKPEGFRFASSKEADTRRKLIRDIKDLETKASIAEIIEAAQRFTTWLTKVDYAKAKEVAVLFDSFIKEHLR